jgi:protein involved in polysaccharide export with SLBB domain
MITISQLDRMVYIYGEVKLPEFYELLPGENLRDLIENYAGGFTPMADTTRIILTRVAENGWDTAERIFLDQGDVDDNFPLLHFDSVHILSK